MFHRCSVEGLLIENTVLGYQNLSSYHFVKGPIRCSRHGVWILTKGRDFVNHKGLESLTKETEKKEKKKEDFCAHKDFVSVYMNFLQFYK
jgi:hypothetical protein